MPDTSSLIFPGPSRSNSLASTVSSSGASLTRRSRTTRKRTRTITRHDDQESEFSNQVLDISAANNADPLQSLVANPSAADDTLVANPHTGTDASSSSDKRAGPDADRSCATFGTFGPLIKDGHDAPPGPISPTSPVHPTSPPGIMPSSPDSVISPPAPKGKGRHPARLTSPPSAFKPAPTEADQVRSSLRDSLLTQQSSTSSSVYPMSTSIGTESPPSPLSPVMPERGIPLSGFELDGPKVQEFDADDVSYRLQLLVKNNYFLPPAHSKPSPADFPSNPKKPPTPTFLDLFRVGKPKSKPASPDTVNGPSPALRVTSDSTTASGQAIRDHGRPSPQTFRPPPGSQHMARVVVVREKMEDLAAAARQAEIDFGGRDFLLDRERTSRKSKPVIFDGIVDPTEMVDLPPPSANYPLALQASALHGLGIEDSVGAAVLAERLPPPGSPGSLDPREHAWRKALLREAVGHSLSSSVATSANSGYSTPMKTPLRAMSTDSLRPQPGIEQQRRMLDQKILSHPIIDPSDDYEPPTPTAKSALNSSALVAVVTDPDVRRLSSLALLRAETPVPHTPLTPPPRRPFGNPQFSRSQTDVSPAKQEAVCQSPKKKLRKSISSPMLSEKHRAHGNMTPSKTPPAVPSLCISPTPSSIHPLDHRISRVTTASRYTTSEHDDIIVADEQPGRPSLALTVQSTDGGRLSVSISEYSQPSPTASAFRDRMSEGYYSATSGGQGAESSRESPAPHHQLPRPPTMSPPPRPSSSIAGHALSPPPRTGYLPFHPTSSRIATVIPPSRSASQSTARSFASISTLSSTHPPPHPLSLNVSAQSFHSAFHSAPPPSSATEFFDQIQAHTDAMYDLDDSDESDTDRDITAVYSTPRKPSLMRLGNLSTPNVVPGAKEPYYPSSATSDRKRPVGHTPNKTPYFSSVKAAPESLTYLSLSQHSRERLYSEGSPQSRRPSTAGSENVRRWQRDQQSFQESSKRLDGLLIRHMQAEKDTMKRIAQTAKVSKP